MEKNDTRIINIIDQEVKYLVPGMEIAKDIHSDDGRILANKGTVINKQTIQQLQNWEVDTISIYEEVLLNPIIDPKVQKFINNYNKSVTVIQNAFDHIRSTQQIPLAELQNTASTLTEQAATAGNIVDQLYNLPPCDDYTMRHSVNVSIISALIAMWLKYPDNIVNSISLAGLLHDVGKSQLPPEILNKPYKLAADEYIHYQQHTKLGYDLVSNNNHVAPSITSAILQHHEREDGSGYPVGLLSEDIHPYAKIVAVADLYDEVLTINRDTETVLSPYISLEILRDNICSLDAESCLIFTTNMTNYLSGNNVVLTNGQQARVVCVNKAQPSRSIVQFADGKVSDLTESLDIRIKHVAR